MRPVVFAIGVVLAAVPLGAYAADDDVGQMIKTFYKWYVPHLDQKPGAKSDHKMSDFVTESLLTRIDKLREPDEESGVAALDWDPFLNAQDYDADWATNVKVEDAQVNGDNATATVQLGGKEKSTVRLILVRNGGRWRIDNFIPKL